MKVLYFTSTGNNLYIAKQLGGELLSIPKLLHEGRLEYEDEAIGIVYPCYYFGTPRLVKEFVEKATLKSEYLFAIMSYGNMSAGGTNHFLGIAQRAGMNLSYLNEILMIDNYLPLFDMEKQIKDAPKKQIEHSLEQIVSDVCSRKKVLKTKNAFVGMMSFFSQKFYAINIRKADSRFLVEETCNGCQICEKVCPVNNIRVNGKPAFLHHCEECLACAHHCPQHAIRVKHERSRARFRNEHVSLKDIIEAHSLQ